MLVPKPTIVLPILLLIFASCTDKGTSPAPKNVASEELKAVFDEFQKKYNNHSEAYELITRVKTLAEEEGNQEYLAKYYAGFGYLQHIDKQYNEAVLAYQHALIIYNLLGDSLRQGWVLNNLGDIYRVTYMPEQALSFFNRAETLYEEIGRQDKLTGLYENIGLTFLDHSNYEAAESYLQKGLYFSEEYDNNEKITVFNNIFGKLHFKQGQYEEARKRYLKALDFVKSELQKAFIYGNIGETYLLEKNPDAAEEWITKAMQVKENIENADIRPNLNYLGIYHAQKGNYEKALNLFDQVVRLSEEDLLEKELGVAMENSNNIYNTQSSLRTDDSFKQTLHYSDILRRSNALLMELQEQLNILYSQSLVKKGEADFAEIKKQKQIAREKAITHMLYGGAITLSIVLIIGSAVYYRKRLKRMWEERERIRKEQEEYRNENSVQKHTIDKLEKCTRAIKEAIAESGLN
ncbi:Tetratricopeptide TPR_2 repeat protein [Fulvivirga imtechensis AK7]|uniref:Tetratricopeptide TPR_2 repeat protein n=1 Tax=Fulvivirga imtechensis AK7 TaxID=1237149 RepID=L8JX28_9BACT|nr:tetratricopeptide repeat protein [Fulvivirga imtechensis]ELR71747.1 Tetratricopeptide TPR_2 repeat protein [Fulvivirga imtechensis AK7]